MWRCGVALLPLLTLVGGASTASSFQQGIGDQVDALDKSSQSPAVLLTAVSDGVTGAFAEALGGEGLNLSSTTTQQEIRPYHKSSSVPFCHNCFGGEAGACRVCLHGEHESSVS